MKEKELVRIPDDKIKQDMAKAIITTHNEALRQDRFDRPERYTFIRAPHFDEIEEKLMASKQSLMKKSRVGTSEEDLRNLNPAEIKQVQVKTANKSIRSLRQGKGAAKGVGGVHDEDNDEISFEIVLSDILATTLANKMGKNDPEYKNFKESYDNVTKYFNERFTYIADELILDVFTEISDKSKDIMTVITKNMVEFNELCQFFIHALENTNP